MRETRKPVGKLSHQTAEQQGGFVSRARLGADYRCVKTNKHQKKG